MTLIRPFKYVPASDLRPGDEIAWAVEPVQKIETFEPHPSQPDVTLRVFVNNEIVKYRPYTLVPVLLPR